MKRHPHHDLIKKIALELLNGQHRIPTLNDWRLKNCVGLAVTRAVDQVRKERRAPPRFFGEANADRVMREIIRERNRAKGGAAAMKI